MNVSIFRYLAQLSTNQIVLWCYLIWYLVMVGFHFEADLHLWGTAFGVSVIVGVALLLSTGSLNWNRIRDQFWDSFRLFLIPFCVSSFSELVKGHGFILVFSPQLMENIIGLGAITLFVISVIGVKSCCSHNSH